MTQFIGQTFPEEWLWSKYERKCIDSISNQIDKRFVGQKNLLVNLTWFGPQFDHQGNSYAQFLEHNQNVDNLFLLATVDPPMITKQQIGAITKMKGDPKVFKLGNFDGPHQFNFFAPIIAEHFKKYDNDDIVLKDPKWHYINYNRKPRQHRVELVKKIIAKGLDKFGLLTLGKPDTTYDNDPHNNLYLTLGEKNEDYVATGHWFTQEDKDDDVGIPHDVLSLHNINYWQSHFLHIIGATEFSSDVDLFISETQYKPILGLRPFVINGNPKTYQWLEEQGFKTFNKYFPGIDLMDSSKVHESIISVIEQLKEMTPDQIMLMYEAMMPDLLHNQKHFGTFARQQQFKIDNLF